MEWIWGDAGETPERLANLYWNMRRGNMLRDDTPIFFFKQKSEHKRIIMDFLFYFIFILLLFFKQGYEGRDCDAL